MILFNLAIAAAHFIERTFVVQGKYNINKEKIKYIDKKILYAVDIDNARAKKLFSFCLKSLYDSKNYEFEIESSVQNY